VISQSSKKKTNKDERRAAARNRRRIFLQNTLFWIKKTGLDTSRYNDSPTCSKAKVQKLKYNPKGLSDLYLINSVSMNRKTVNMHSICHREAYNPKAKNGRSSGDINEICNQNERKGCDPR
jgi:hypothetical protein